MSHSLDTAFFVKHLSNQVFLKRVRHSNNKKEPFRKAFGNLTADDVLVDGTVGLGRDLLCMASWGLPTVGFERNPFVYDCLQTAIGELSKTYSAELPWLTSLQLLNGDARFQLNTLDFRPTHIYLDPIYPEKSKSALGKLALRQLKQIVGDDEDGPELLRSALLVARKRVIVKRPLKAAFLVETPKISGQILGRSTRYDLYVP